MGEFTTQFRDLLEHFAGQTTAQCLDGREVAGKKEARFCLAPSVDVRESVSGCSRFVLHPSQFGVESMLGLIDLQPILKEYFCFFGDGSQFRMRMEVD